MNQLECLAQLYIDHQNLHAEYAQLLGVLDQVKSGAIDPARLLIDLPSKSWQLNPIPPVEEAAAVVTN